MMQMLIPVTRWLYDLEFSKDGMIMLTTTSSALSGSEVDRVLKFDLTHLMMFQLVLMTV